MAQEPTDRRRRPSAHMVKAECYFLSNWSLQRLLSRGEPRRTNRDRHAHSVCSCADPPAARVRAAPLDGRPCSVLGNYAHGHSPAKTRCRPATSRVNKPLSAPKPRTQPARAAFNPAHMVNIDLSSALSFWPVASLTGTPHVIPDLARLSLRKLAPRRGRCQHCAVRPERLDGELVSVDLARRRRRAGKAGGESAARHRRPRCKRPCRRRDENSAH